MGFGSYLSDGWNWIDFFVVVSSASQQIIEAFHIGNGKSTALSALRAFRLLRPLKLLSSVPSLRMLLGTLINSVQSLGNIMGLACFFFTIFSILGVALLQGKIHYRCYDTPEPIDGEWKLTEGFEELCSESYNQCPTGSYCRSKFEAYNPDGSPYVFNNPDLWADTDFEAFNFGITQFDDVVSAFLTIFICTTQDGWTNIMSVHLDIFNPVFIRFYFITCVWVCGFFILNMTVATMLMKYEEEDQNTEDTEPDQFEIELKEIGKKIFGQHTAIVDFLIDQPSVKIDEKAGKHLAKEKSFIQKFF